MQGVKDHGKTIKGHTERHATKRKQKGSKKTKSKSHEKEMNADDVLKAILDQGAVTIKEVDLKQVKDKQIGMAQSWDDDGKITWTIYTHDGAVKK